MTRLKGMTWNHPRGYDPLVAASAEWLKKTGIAIDWDKRSLQDFETYPVEDLARQYDLIVIDHPHVGQITAEACLSPLDVEGYEDARADMAAHSVGQSYASYHYAGRQWAFPVDAATQVQAYRPDRAEPARDWGAVTDRARRGEVLVPLRAPHSLMGFFTLTANLGAPCATMRGPLTDRAVGERAIGMLAELAALCDPACFDMDPIAVFEAMAAGGAVTTAPLIYGYVNYAIKGFRPHVLAFADMPVAGTHGPVGSALGGTGIAVSAFSAHRTQAIAFAHWVAGADVQRGLYARHGGQPGHGLAWEDEAVNAATGNFYRATRATLEGAWLRPRHDGYMAFQSAAAERLNAGLKTHEAPGAILAALNTLFEESF